MFRSLNCLRVGLDMYTTKSSMYTNQYLRGAERVLASYTGRDWEKFKKCKPLSGNQYGDYDRIPVMETEKCSVFLMKWYPYSCTSIHCHSTAGCLYKVVEGSVLEQRFKVINDGIINNGIINNNLPKLKDLPIEELNTRTTRYIGHSIYHRMFKNLPYDSEPISMKNSYSLHVYERAKTPIVYEELGIDKQKIDDKKMVFPGVTLLY